ncbi:MAG: sulfatase [Verrucomicrobiaceae bacterium]|nr:sulfatase [Verrucomicrobiaceae bacterium]
MKIPGLALITIALLITLPAHANNRAAKVSVKPNVLFIAVDDLNDWVGSLGGHPQAQTPNMDRLVSRGLLFTRAYCSAPGCNASRSSLLTGLRPSTTGIYANAHDWRQAPRLKNAITLPAHFKANGYITLGAGKLFHSHTFFDKKNLSGYPDPDAWNAYFPSKTQQMPEEVVPEKWPVNSNRKFYGGHFDWAPLQIPNAKMADAKVVSWAAGQLGKRHAKPLFLSVGIYRPHVPWYVPQEYFDRFPLDGIRLPKHLQGDLNDIPEPGKNLAKRNWHEWITGNGQWKKAVQGYLASLAFADDMVGELINALDNGPMANDTLIVFWGDHGYHLGEKEHWEKFALWENTTHVPLAIIDPLRTKPGSRCKSPVSLLDIYPTLVETCGLKATPQALEGRSLAGIFKTPEKETHRVVISTQGKGNHAARSSRYRYIRYTSGEEELYDHRSDPHEWRNIADDQSLAAVKQHLAGQLPGVNAEPIKVKREK